LVASQSIQPAAAPAPGTAAAPWTYAQAGADWTGTCSTGKKQSPIAIDSDNLQTTSCVRDGEEASIRHRINFFYKPVVNLSVTHTGYTLQVAGDLGFVTIGGCNPCAGQEFDVKQIQFHAAAEHLVNNKTRSLELHIVHQKKGSTDLSHLAIVAIQFYIQGDGGFDNAFLQSLDWDHLPGSANAVNGPLKTVVDLNRLTETLQGEYFTYHGSLTTPSCDETVKWFVMKTPLGITRDQYNKINALFAGRQDFAAGKGNNRAIQPLNDRKVIWFRKRL
jgi:carbonic anhydrase